MPKDRPGSQPGAEGAEHEGASGRAQSGRRRWLSGAWGWPQSLPCLTLAGLDPQPPFSMDSREEKPWKMAAQPACSHPTSPGPCTPSACWVQCRELLLIPQSPLSNAPSSGPSSCYPVLLNSGISCVYLSQEPQCHCRGCACSLPLIFHTWGSPGHEW